MKEDVTINKDVLMKKLNRVQQGLGTSGPYLFEVLIACVEALEVAEWKLRENKTHHHAGKDTFEEIDLIQQALKQLQKVLNDSDR